MAIEDNHDEKNQDSKVVTVRNAVDFGSRSANIAYDGLSPGGRLRTEMLQDADIPLCGLTISTGAMVAILGAFQDAIAATERQYQPLLLFRKLYHRRYISERLEKNISECVL